MSAIICNVTRDLPDQGVAPWVSANDKPTLLSKPAVGDVAEQRLKTEVMQLPARDRRRLKEVHNVSLLTEPLHILNVETAVQHGLTINSSRSKPTILTL